MIHTATGTDVERLMRRVAESPHAYAEVVICSPFIDDLFIPTLVEVITRATHAGCSVRVVTSSSVAARIQESLPQPTVRWKGAVLVHRHLHAKIYLALARERTASEAIVTSANLTRHGVHENVELGIRAVSNTDTGRTILQQVKRFVARLAA